MDLFGEISVTNSDKELWSDSNKNLSVTPPAEVLTKKLTTSNKKSAQQS
ncbi:MAG: hypothetical protein DID90_2727552377 [Candidatus Nitrotoga sp. LAW]|nr:MAG: hypothetical protein DID90_2727552377 [Candidatus Nitrotoga sp. LAW]